MSKAVRNHDGPRRRGRPAAAARGSLAKFFDVLDGKPMDPPAQPAPPEIVLAHFTAGAWPDEVYAAYWSVDRNRIPGLRSKYGAPLFRTTRRPQGHVDSFDDFTEPTHDIIGAHTCSAAQCEADAVDALWFLLGDSLDTSVHVFTCEEHRAATYRHDSPEAARAAGALVVAHHEATAACRSLSTAPRTHFDPFKLYQWLGWEPSGADCAQGIGVGALARELEARCGAHRRVVEDVIKRLEDAGRVRPVNAWSKSKHTDRKPGDSALFMPLDLAMIYRRVRDRDRRSP